MTYRNIIGVLGAVAAAALLVGAPVEAATQDKALEARVAALKKQNAKQVKTIRKLRAGLASTRRTLANTTVELDAVEQKRQEIEAQFSTMRILLDDKSRRVVDLESAWPALIAERDGYKANLATAQSGVAGTITTMNTEQGWALMPSLLSVFPQTPTGRYWGDHTSMSQNGEVTFESYCYYDSH